MEFRRLLVSSSTPVVVDTAQPVVDRPHLLAGRAQPVAFAEELFARAAQPVAAARLPVAANARPFAAFRQPVAPALERIVNAEQRLGKNVRLFVARVLPVVSGPPEDIRRHALALVKRRHAPAGASYGTPA